MAEASVPSGRIKPSDADQVFVAALVVIATALVDGVERDNAMVLLRRALPMVSQSTRMQRLKPLAEAVLVTGPVRRRPDGSGPWASAVFALNLGLARDAYARAIALVGE